MCYVWQTSDNIQNCLAMSESDDHIEGLLDRRMSENTRRVIRSAITVFSAYTRARNTSLSDLHRLPQTEVNKLLCLFYAEATKKNGSSYTRGAWVSLRYGLQKHFFKTCGYDIIHDPAFQSSCEVFSAVIEEVKKQGKTVVQYKQPLSAADLSKLYCSSLLSTSNAVGLQNKVFVDLMVHLCNPARENLRGMKKADFCISTDSTAGRYVSLSNRFAKKHPRDASDKTGRKRRMYSLPGNPQCPVASFEKYLKKLNGARDDFWQKPTTMMVTEENACWYKNSCVGKDTLASKMKTLSVDAQLSTIYTNHCFPSASVTTSESVLD